MQVRKYLPELALSIVFLLFTSNSFAAKTNFQAPENGDAKSRIIASFYNDSKGNAKQKLIAGFELKLGDGWKTYAPDKSGQTNFMGSPPVFNFKDSTNIDLAKINPLFPDSQIEKDKIGSETIEYGVYKEKIIIPLELEVIDSEQETHLEIEVNYGLCKEICIPATQKFSLTIPARQNDAEALSLIQQYLGVTIISNTLEAFPAQQESAIITPKFSLIRALLIAFIGGAILNIMPCVLPVLSIKLLSVIKHSQSKLSKIRWAFLSTTLGIIFSFLVFAGVALFLKSIGNAVGWGLQFQNPYFLLFLLIILMVFIANLLGLFELNFGNSLSSALNKKITKDEEGSKKNIFLPNFLSGILAVLLATPCSAPFVGVAISFALSSDKQEIFLIFGAMALGFASPYLFLITFPKAVRILPKAGSWMTKTRQLMAGFLAATAVWLIYILINNLGFFAAMSAGLLAIMFLLFFKLVHKLHFSETSKIKFILSAILFIFLIAATFIIPNRLADLNKIMEKSQQENWIKFDETKIADLVGQGKTVIVDITADWCITCKANKLLVLNSSEIVTKLKEPNIVAMRGDLTKPDELIFIFMKKHNRYGIPFNLVFGPAAPNGILTSELLNKDALLKAIEKASQPQ